MSDGFTSAIQEDLEVACRITNELYSSLLIIRDQFRHSSDDFDDNRACSVELIHQGRLKQEGIMEIKV